MRLQAVQGVLSDVAHDRPMTPLICACVQAMQENLLDGGSGIKPLFARLQVLQGDTSQNVSIKPFWNAQGNNPMSVHVGRQCKGISLMWPGQLLTLPWTCGLWGPLPLRCSPPRASSAARATPTMTSSPCCWALSPCPASPSPPSGTRSGTLQHSAWCRTFSDESPSNAHPSTRSASCS